MKKRTMLTLAASFTLAGSAPVIVPAAENTARSERMVAQSASECPRGHIDGYTVRLTAVFNTQSPKAIEKLEQRGVIICLDERISTFAADRSDRDAIRYLRAWNRFTLPDGSTYAERPRIFNTIVDASRTTLWEGAGNLAGAVFSGLPNNRAEEAARRDGALLRAHQAGQTTEGNVAVQVHMMTHGQ